MRERGDYLKRGDFLSRRQDQVKARTAPVPKVGAVIYCRVSTEDQRVNFSLETQFKHCRRFCADAGMRIIK